MDKIDKFLRKYLDKAREQEVSLQENDLICPLEETIACYLDNLLDANERAEVEEHLLKCENCLRQTILLHGIKSETNENSPIGKPPVVRAGDDANNRAHPRVSTLLPVEFKFHPGHNGVISGKANILNLSEGGLLMGEIKASCEKRGEDIPDPVIEGEALYDLRFALADDLGTVDAKGECVRVNKTHNDINVGVSFRDIKQDNMQKIRDYTQKMIEE